MAFEILEQEPGKQVVICEWALSEIESQWNELKEKGLPEGVFAQSLAQACLLLYLQERGYVPWREPLISELNLDQAKLSFKADLALLPKMALPEYKGLQIEVPLVPVPNEDDLLERISLLQLGVAQEQVIDRGIAWGDRVYLDFLVKVGEQIVPLSAKADYPVLIENELFFPGFAESLIGHQAGDRLEVRTHLPLDYAYPAWRGREAVYQLTIRRVCSLQIPPLDAHFPALIHKGESVPELMQSLYDDILAENQLSWQDVVGELLMAKLVPKCEFDVPDALIDAENLSAWERLDLPALQAMGLDSFAIEQAKTTWMKFRNLREEAFWRVSGALVLRAIAMREGITLIREEWHQHLAALGECFGQDEMTWVTELQSQREIGVLADRLILDKTLQWLVSHAEICFAGQLLSPEVV